MARLPMFVGIAVLELSFETASAVKKYRGVVFDQTSGVSTISGGWGKIKLPTTAYTDAEHPVGVVQGPNPVESLDPATPNPNIVAGREVNVRVMGLTAVETDNSTAGAPILPGDLVAFSNVASYEGCVKKATLASGIPAADQNILGLSYSRVVNDNAYAQVLIAPRVS